MKFLSGDLPASASSWWRVQAGLYGRPGTDEAFPGCGEDDLAGREGSVQALWQEWTCNPRSPPTARGTRACGGAKGGPRNLPSWLNVNFPRYSVDIHLKSQKEPGLHQ